MSVIIKKSGDVFAAEAYRHYAIRNLNTLRHQMTFSNLKQAIAPPLKFDNGVVITCSINHGTEIANIHYPIEIQVREIKEPIFWEPWDGSTDNLCVKHTWRCGMTDPNLQRHDFAYCDGSFTLDPPVYHPSYPDVPAHHVDVINLYWLDLSGGWLKSSFWREPAGSYAGYGYVNYRTSYMEWQASLDTVNPTLHQGKRNLQVKINTNFVGFQEGDFLPNFSVIAIELTDVNSNFVRLYLKADPAYLTSIGQSDYLVGDGIVNIAFSDWGLDSDLAKIFLFTYSDFSDDNRIVNYQCDYIDLY